MIKVMRTALVRTDINCHKVMRYDDYETQKAFAEDLRGNGYKVLKIWNGNISDAEVEQWHFLNRHGDTTCKNSEKAVKASVKVEEVSTAAKNNPLQEKIAGLRTAEKIISEKYLNVCRNLYVKIDGEYYLSVGFDDYVTKFHDKFYSKEGNNYVEDAAAYSELKAIESEWNEIFKKLEYFENIEAKADILKAKIAEQKKNRKPIIDWNSFFEDMQISEILDLQKDLKKFLKVGQIDLAENVFSMLKTLCRNYRAAA